jgi:hypothetical protein
VETFNPETKKFVVLPVSLPSQLQLQKVSVAFIVNEELFLLTSGKQMARWEINSGHEFSCSNTGKGIWSSQQPLIVGSVALIAHEKGVIHFSLETYSFIKYIA